MLKIPVSARLTNGQPVKNVQASLTSSVVEKRPQGMPMVSEVDRIRILRQQKFWRNVANCARTSNRLDVNELTVDSQSPSP